jgi:hypothetical protein
MIIYAGEIELRTNLIEKNESFHLKKLLLLAEVVREWIEVYEGTEGGTSEKIP